MARPNREDTHCPRRHLMSKQNTIWRKTKNGEARVCRTCNLARQKAYYNKTKNLYKELVPVNETRCCSVCLKESVRISVRTSTGRLAFVDQYGGKWDCRQCPACHKAKRQKYQKEVEYVPAVRLKVSGRKCRQCQGPVTVDRYFTCVKCVPELPSDDTYMSQFHTPSGAFRREE